MAGKNTITKDDRFVIGDNGTFIIVLDEVILTFEICEGDPQSTRFIRLKSPEKISLEVKTPTAEWSAEWWETTLREAARGSGGSLPHEASVKAAMDKALARHMRDCGGLLPGLSEASKIEGIGLNADLMGNKAGRGR